MSEQPQNLEDALERYFRLTPRDHMNIEEIVEATRNCLPAPVPASTRIMYAFGTTIAAVAAAVAVMVFPPNQQQAPPSPAKLATITPSSLPRSNRSLPPMMGAGLAEVIGSSKIISGKVTRRFPPANPGPNYPRVDVRGTPIDQFEVQLDPPLLNGIKITPSGASRTSHWPVGSLVSGRWNDLPGVHQWVVVFQSDRGTCWASFDNKKRYQAFRQRVKAYADGSIHKTLTQELLNPPEKPWPLAKTNRLLRDLAVLGQPGDGKAVVEYVQRLDAGKVSHSFELMHRNQIAWTLVALMKRGDKSSRQLAKKIVASRERYSTGALESLQEALESVEERHP